MMKEEEDKDIRDLFEDFRPGLSSDDVFMSRLAESLDRMEIVKEYNERRARRSRLATICALVVGFVCGMTATLAWPYVAAWLTTINISIPDFTICLNGIELDTNILFYSILTAALTALLMVKSYSAVLSGSFSDSSQ